MSPSLAVELARLLLGGASRETVAGRLALEPKAPALEAILSVGERARRTGASEEEAALALGLLGVLGAAVTPESSAS